MNHDAILRDLAAERVGDLLPMLRRAFETGYREGMAAVGSSAPAQPVVASSEPAMPEAPVPAPSGATEGLEAAAEQPPVAGGPADEPEEEEDDDLLEEAAPGDGQPTRPRFRGVRASATVNGLLKKIEQVFRLEERFELVVRIESPKTGRALNRNARLSTYVRKEG